MSTVEMAKLLECPEDISALVADLVGRKYDRDGHGPEGPLSCWGLLRTVYARLGIVIPAFPYPAEAMEMCREVPYRIAGNAVLLKIGDLTHVGVMVTKTRMIHSSREKGVAIEHLRNFWKDGVCQEKRQLRPIRVAASAETRPC